MKKTTILWFTLFCIGICISSCASEPTANPVPQASNTPENSAPPAETSALQRGATATLQIISTSTSTIEPENTSQAEIREASDRDLLKYRGQYFSASGECSVCHQQMIDKNGRDVSIETHWRASMMANASRDPYYLAKVRDEARQYQKFKAAIESKCGQCHLPMGVVTAENNGQSRQLFDEGLLSPEHEYYLLSMDGVSCTACHQIMADNVGNPDSFNGNFIIDSEEPAGDRLVYGPYLVEENMALIMNSASGYTPRESTHMHDAAFCAICHTLFTNTITVEGELTEHLFAEQTPFLEWLNSQYSPQIACQNCHMPIASGEVNTSIIGGQPRSPFYQHIFVGGNSYMLKLMQNNADALYATAESEHFQQKYQEVTTQLQERSAKLSVSVEREAGMLYVAVKIVNLTGHKFPTGFPSRRAWLHAAAIDLDGNVTFESGSWREDGLIAGSSNDENPGEYEQHYQTIDDASQVQIYEAIFVDTDEKVSTSLINAYQYVKDNRLLPAGFDMATAPQEIKPVGGAAMDESFSAGSDTITYVIPLDGDSAPARIEIELLYQTIGYPWLKKQVSSQTVEGQAFAAYHANTQYDPVVIDRIEINVP